MTGPARLRLAVHEDLPSLTEIAWLAKSSWGYPRSWLESVRAELTLQPAQLLTARVMVAEADGQALGFYVLTPREPEWELDHLWVHPRAQRGGLGTMLVRDAQSQAAAADRRGLRIDADPHAESFYTRMGAARVGAIAAPLPGEPERVRPQLWLPSVAPSS